MLNLQDVGSIKSYWLEGVEIDSLQGESEEEVQMKQSFVDYNTSTIISPMKPKTGAPKSMEMARLELARLRSVAPRPSDMIGELPSMSTWLPSEDPARGADNEEPSTEGTDLTNEPIVIINPRKASQGQAQLSDSQLAEIRSYLYEASQAVNRKSPSAHKDSQNSRGNVYRLSQSVHRNQQVAHEMAPAAYHKDVHTERRVKAKQSKVLDLYGKELEEVLDETAFDT